MGPQIPKHCRWRDLDRIWGKMNVCFTICVRIFLKNDVISGMNGVGMDRYGLILNQNGDLSFRKVFKYLPGLNNTIKTIDLTTKYTNLDIYDFPYI